MNHGATADEAAKQAEDAREGCEGLSGLTQEATVGHPPLDGLAVDPKSPEAGRESDDIYSHTLVERACTLGVSADQAGADAGKAKAAFVQSNREEWAKSQAPQVPATREVALSRYCCHLLLTQAESAWVEATYQKAYAKAVIEHKSPESAAKVASKAATKYGRWLASPEGQIAEASAAVRQASTELHDAATRQRAAMAAMQAAQERRALWESSCNAANACDYGEGQAAYDEVLSKGQAAQTDNDEVNAAYQREQAASSIETSAQQTLRAPPSHSRGAAWGQILSGALVGMAAGSNAANGAAPGSFTGFQALGAGYQATQQNQQQQAATTRQPEAV